MRISASSSTIRMSCAMADGTHLPLLVRQIRPAALAERKNQADPRPDRLAVLENQLPLVIFHDLFDDGETQARPLGARRHIGLGQTLAALLRQTLAVVLDDDGGLLPRLDQRHAQERRGVRPLFGDSRLDRLDAVLDDIDDRLADKPRIAADHDRMRRQHRLEGDLGMGGLLQDDGAAHDLDQIVGPQHRRRHPRKCGKLVDHAADIADMADDRVGADGKGLGILLDLPQVFATQPFGRELDRRQRVLDLVGDTAGDVGPGRFALGRQKLGDVVEGDDKAAVVTVGFGGEAERFGRLMRPDGSSPITPADTPASTVSVNRRRSSSWRFASFSSRCWVSIWCVMRLKARTSEASSSSFSPSGTRAVKSPPLTRSAAVTRRLIGTAIWVAKWMPTTTAATRNSSATIMKMRAKVIWKPDRCPSIRRYCAAARWVSSIWAMTRGSI